ncbi:uncharacterized protein LOC118204284, partial [Stegodyphus dumicola]|uniref:uncharacterized protein LOC118204284 n=1 Tax=Stegodyphus dumicola TaxID=202533 RepID=UPI0015B072E5
MKLVKRGITRKCESAAHAEQKDRATTAKKEVCPNQSTRSRKPENEHSAPTASSSPPPQHGNEKKRVRLYKRVSFYRSPAPSLCVPEHHTLTRVMAESQGPVTNVQVRRQGPRTRMSFQAEETSVQEDTLYAEQKERATRAKKEVHPNQSTRSRKPKNEHSASSASSSPPPPLL